MKLTKKQLIIGGLVALAVVGVGIYMWKKHKDIKKAPAVPSTPAVAPSAPSAPPTPAVAPAVAPTPSEAPQQPEQFQYIAPQGFADTTNPEYIQ